MEKFRSSGQVPIVFQGSYANTCKKKMQLCKSLPIVRGPYGYKVTVGRRQAFKNTKRRRDSTIRPLLHPSGTWVLRWHKENFVDFRIFVLKITSLQSRRSVFLLLTGATGRRRRLPPTRPLRGQFVFRVVNMTVKRGSIFNNVF